VYGPSPNWNRAAGVREVVSRTWNWPVPTTLPGPFSSWRAGGTFTTTPLWALTIVRESAVKTTASRGVASPPIPTATEAPTR
jgi:hypothetical protein